MGPKAPVTAWSDRIQSCPFSTNEAPHADLTRRTQAPQAEEESGFQLLVSGHRRCKAEHPDRDSLGGMCEFHSSFSGVQVVLFLYS